MSLRGSPPAGAISRRPPPPSLLLPPVPRGARVEGGKDLLEARRDLLRGGDLQVTAAGAPRLVASRGVMVRRREVAVVAVGEGDREVFRERFGGFQGEADFDEDLAGNGGDGERADAEHLEFHGDGCGEIGEREGLEGVDRFAVGELAVGVAFGGGDDFTTVIKTASNEGFLGKLISLGAILNLVTFFAVTMVFLTSKLFSRQVSTGNL